MRGLAIDLGTANVLVWAQGRGIVLNEPTVLAMNQHTGDVLAVGHEAYAMIGRTPAHIVAERPLRGGAITNFEDTAKLLGLVVKKAGRGRFGKLNRVRALICVPSAITGVERRAVEEAAKQAGVTGAFLLEEPMAAAIGAGLPVHKPTGSMIVDVGGGTSEVAIVSLGGIVASKAVRMGGFDFDATIQRYIRDSYALAIGERTAEEIKIAVGSAYPQEEEAKAEIRGRELATGLPKVVMINASEIREALDDCVQTVVDAVLDTLAQCPPELMHDIMDRGLWLVGGGALLKGLDARIAEEAQLQVNLVEQPLHAVVTGAGAVIDAFDEVGSLFTSD